MLFHQLLDKAMCIKMDNQKEDTALSSTRCSTHVWITFSIHCFFFLSTSCTNATYLRMIKCSFLYVAAQFNPEYWISCDRTTSRAENWRFSSHEAKGQVCHFSFRKGLNKRSNKYNETTFHEYVWPLLLQVLNYCILYCLLCQDFLVPPRTTVLMGESSLVAMMDSNLDQEMLLIFYTQPHQVKPSHTPSVAFFALNIQICICIHKIIIETSFASNPQNLHVIMRFIFFVCKLTWLWHLWHRKCEVNLINKHIFLN